MTLFTCSLLKFNGKSNVKHIHCFMSTITMGRIGCLPAHISNLQGYIKAPSV